MPDDKENQVTIQSPTGFAVDDLFGKDRVTNAKEFRLQVARQLRIIEECGVGEDLRQGLQRTPQRVTRMWLEELTAGYSIDVPSLFRTFDDHEGYDGMVALTRIPVRSQCEHHLVPFVGYAHIAYFPGDRVIGLSKLPRVVDAFARRLQLQERLTQQIHDSLDENLDPRGVIVVIECEHLCMTLRGIQSPGTKTMTSAVSGLFRDTEERAKEEFFSLIKNGH